MPKKLRASGQRPKFDLLAELQNAGYKTTGSMTFDLATFAEEAAGRIADQIRENLSGGTRPDGARPMPKGKIDRSRPRGQGTEIAASIHATEWKPGYWKIVADEKVPGQLRRVLKGARLKLPVNTPEILRAALKEMLDGR